MFRIDDATAAGSLPAPETAGTEGYFTEGNPATNTLATKVRGSWLNMIQEELRAIVVAAGLQPTKGLNNQVLQAITAMTSGVVGTSRNAKMSIATASASATFTADEVILESALCGLRYCLANVSDTFNLTTDMDTGSAPTSGYVALYKLYNPTTGASIRRIVNATSTIAPEIYAGAAPPAGYTASALVGVWPTNASGQFVAGLQRGRRVSISQVQVLNTSTPQALPTALSIAGAVPRNAKTASGSYAITNSAANGGASAYIAGDSAWAGQAYASITTSVGGNGVAAALPGLDMDVSQTLYYTLSGTGGTATLIIWISGYMF